MKLFSVLKNSEHCYLSSIIGEYRHIESYDKETAKLKGQPNFFSDRMIKHNKFTVYFSLVFFKNTQKPHKKNETCSDVEEPNG